MESLWQLKCSSTLPSSSTPSSSQEPRDQVSYSVPFCIACECDIGEGRAFPLLVLVQCDVGNVNV